MRKIVFLLSYILGKKNHKWKKWASPLLQRDLENFFLLYMKWNKAPRHKSTAPCASVRSLSIPTTRHCNPSRDSPGLIALPKTADQGSSPYVGKATSSQARCLFSSPYALCGLAKSWVSQWRSHHSSHPPQFLVWVNPARFLRLTEMVIQTNWKHLTCQTERC